MPDRLQGVDLSLVDRLMVPASLHDVNGRFRSNAQLLGHHFAEPLPPERILAFDARPPPSEPIGLAPQPRLTPRQREILDLLASGLSTSEIAKKLTLSTETVRNHPRSVFRELHAHTRLEAIAAARRLGLLAPPALGPQAYDPGVDTE